MRLLPFAAALLFASATAAQDAPRRDPEFDVVNLQAQASREVQNDQLAAVLAVEAHGPDPAALAEALNRRMAQALKTAAAFPSVRLRSGSYQSFPRYRQNQRVDDWQLSQELRLESSDVAAATALIGKLQEDLVVRDMSVRLSAAARRAAEDELIKEAIAAFRARAELVRELMKAAGYRIRSMSIETAGSAPGPVPMERGRVAAQAAVAVDAGSSDVTVTVSGSIQLR